MGKAENNNEMLLNDWEIAKRLLHEDENKRLYITPLINTDYQIGPSSIDLRLGTEFEVIMVTQCEYIDILKKEEVITKMSQL